MSNLALVTAAALIFALSTALSARSPTTIVPSVIFAEVTASSANFAVVIAPVATTGKAAVPPKSPANCIFPFTVVDASAIVAEAT